MWVLESLRKELHKKRKISSKKTKENIIQRVSHFYLNWSLEMLTSQRESCLKIGSKVCLFHSLLFVSPGGVRGGNFRHPAHIKRQDIVSLRDYCYQDWVSWLDPWAATSQPAVIQTSLQPSRRSISSAALRSAFRVSYEKLAESPRVATNSNKNNFITKSNFRHVHSKVKKRRALLSRWI